MHFNRKQQRAGTKREVTDSQTGRDRDSNKVAQRERETDGGGGGAETKTARNRLAETEDNHIQKESERQTDRQTD